MKRNRLFITISLAAVLAVGGALLCGFVSAEDSNDASDEIVEDAGNYGPRYVDEPYFTTIYGAQMTKQEYLNLLAGFTPTGIYTMPTDVVIEWSALDDIVTTDTRGEDDVFHKNCEAVEMNYEEYVALVNKDYTPNEIDRITQNEFDEAIG